ncbi:MAG: hypothetical protein Q8N37_04560 [bacterium]|nr:hypothetical protein [bacterium]
MKIELNENADCQGKKFGHNFENGYCLKCGVSQQQLSHPVKKIEKTKYNPIHKLNKNLHSDIHYVADEISLYFGERKKFGMYLGIIKRIGTDKAWQLFSEIKQNAEEAKKAGKILESPAKLFIWKTKNKK